MIPLLVPSTAKAHQTGLSSVRIDTYQVSLAFARAEIGAFAPVGDIDAGRLLIVEAIVPRMRLEAGGPCTFEAATARELEGDGLLVEVPYHCPSTAGEWTYSADYFPLLTPGHRQYLEVAGRPMAVLSTAEPAASFAGVSSTGSVALEFGRLGVEHIWTGYDHLAFLAGLLLAAPSLRDMLIVVTGFTVAHSITLSLAATGVFTLSPSVVEPAIAASIVYVGVENLFRPPFRRRAVLTFLLGLVHGFGFAGLLAELGLPPDNLAVALLSFNGGVEVGQAAVVAVLLPLILRLRRVASWDGRWMPGLSLAVALAGLYWLLERTLL